MNIQIKDNSNNGDVLVRHVNWEKRCQEQTKEIQEQINNTIKELEELKNTMSRIKDYMNDLYDEEYPDLSEENNDRL